MTHSKEDLKKYNAMTKAQLIKEIDYWIGEYYKEQHQHATFAGLFNTAVKGYHVLSGQYKHLVDLLRNREVELPINEALDIAEVLNNIVEIEVDPNKK